MKKSEIQDKLQTITIDVDETNFVYDFLSCFGLSKTTITRLRKGDYNLSKNEGELLYKGKIFFKVDHSGHLINTIDELSKDDKILKQKPRFIVVTDFRTIVATDTKLKNNKEFPIAELGEQVDFFLPLSGAEIYRVSKDNKLDREAAYKLGELYDILVVDNPEWIAMGSHQLNIFLSRLLFCFFAEDTGIFLGKSMFTEALANNTRADGNDVDEFLSLLFKKLNTQPEHGDFPSYLRDFPYVNGGLFRDEITCPKFSRKARRILIDSGELDWSEINPDIFGSMIQAVADPAERSDLGMHYTSVENILKLIKPLFLDKLYEEFDKNRDHAKALNRLLIRLSKIKFFDPACGSGNFLIITYKELRNLEIQIIKRLIDLDKAQRKIHFTGLELSQFYGIEIKGFAHEMAILSLWLTEHQMNQIFVDELLDYGKSKPILPLKESAHITQGNAARVAWETVCPTHRGDEIYVIGNPPYLGARVQDGEQKADMDYVFHEFNKYRDLDYISIWFYKGSKYIEGKNAQLGFVSTNSISQGQQVALLWDKVLRAEIEISFAHLSFKWTNNAKGNAGVTVIILGLRNISSQPKYIFTESVAKPVKNINPYLLDAPNVVVAERMKPISDFAKMNFGNMANDGGHLLLTTEEKKLFVQKNSESKRFIKKFIGSLEFLRGIDKYCLWIEDDFKDEALSLKLIKERVEKTRQTRSTSKRTTTKKLAETPYKFAEIRHKSTDAIIVPRVSSERRPYIPLGFLDANTVISDSALAIYDAQPWLFGILHSKMHMVWVDAIGGKLKTDYRYSAKLCYNTFPFPPISDKQKETINQYVFSILDERAKYPEKTMAWLYNPESMPNGLKQAHQELDRAIERIYRLAPFASDEERLELLFKLYDEMTKKETLFAKEKKTRRKKSTVDN